MTVDQRPSLRIEIRRPDGTARELSVQLDPNRPEWSLQLCEQAFERARAAIEEELRR